MSIEHANWTKKEAYFLGRKMLSKMVDCAVLDTVLQPKKTLAIFYRLWLSGVRSKVVSCSLMNT